MSKKNRAVDTGTTRDAAAHGVCHDSETPARGSLREKGTMNIGGAVLRGTAGVC